MRWPAVVVVLGSAVVFAAPTAGHMKLRGRLDGSRARCEGTVHVEAAGAGCWAIVSDHVRCTGKAQRDSVDWLLSANERADPVCPGAMYSGGLPGLGTCDEPHITTNESGTPTRITLHLRLAVSSPGL